MELTYRQIISAKPFLEGMLQSKPSPTAKLAAQMARNIRLLSRVLEDVSVAHNTILAPYRDGEGKLRDLSEDEEKALDADFNELLNTTTEVDVHPLRISDIEAVEKAKPGFEISLATFYEVPWMFDDRLAT